MNQLHKCATQRGCLKGQCQAQKIDWPVYPLNHIRRCRSKNTVLSFTINVAHHCKRNHLMTTILQHLLFSPFDTEALVRDGGLLIICLAVFAQTGLFFCVLCTKRRFSFVGGMFISTGKLDHDLVTACLCPVFAAVAGCVAGYWFDGRPAPIISQERHKVF